MDDLLANPYWHALRTEHAGIALGGALARRYPADVIPLAGVPFLNEDSLAALHALLAPGEAVLVTSNMPLVFAGLRQTAELPGLQMICTPEAQAGNGLGEGVVPLCESDIPEMLALKQIAFPGYFGPRAASLGSFYGVRVGGALVAMAGERLALPGWREVSAVCTHPAHTGHGYAAALIRRLLHVHARAGVRSFLGVTATNSRAIALYRRLGCVERRELMWRWVERVG